MKHSKNHLSKEIEYRKKHPLLLSPSLPHPCRLSAPHTPLPLVLLRLLSHLPSPSIFPCFLSALPSPLLLPLIPPLPLAPSAIQGHQSAPPTLSLLPLLLHILLLPTPPLRRLTAPSPLLPPLALLGLLFPLPLNLLPPSLPNMAAFSSLLPLPPS